MSHADVQLIQDALIWTGNYVGLKDGRWGELTDAAVSAWRKSINVTGPGRLTPALYKVLITFAERKKNAVGWTILSDPSTGASIGYPSQVSNPPIIIDNGGEANSIYEGSILTLTTSKLNDLNAVVAYFESLSFKYQFLKVTYRFDKQNRQVISADTKDGYVYGRFDLLGQVWTGFLVLYRPIPGAIEPFITAISTDFSAAGTPTIKPDEPHPFYDTIFQKSSDLNETLSRLRAQQAQLSGTGRLDEQTSSHPLQPEPTYNPAQNYSPAPLRSESSASWLLFVIGAGVAALIAWSWHKNNIEKNNLARSTRIAMKEINDQAEKLRIRKLQLVTQDIYGTFDFTKWDKEKFLFVNQRISPLLISAGLEEYIAKISDSLFLEIEIVASREGRDRSSVARYISDPYVFDARMSPIDYERHCAILLKDNGWTTNMTSVTGDQGADVIAEKNGTRLVLQCKLYSQPVGNKAVQEAFSARNFQNCDFAAVVSNQPFTPSARQISATTGVYLLHHDQLASFDPQSNSLGSQSRSRSSDINEQRWSP